AILKHAGKFHHTAQLNLSPTAANVRRAQRFDEVSSFRLKLGMRLGKLLNLFAQLRISTHPTFLELADLSVDFFKRIFEWLDHVADGRLPPFEFASCCLLKRFEVLFREIEER